MKPLRPTGNRLQCLMLGVVLSGLTGSVYGQQTFGPSTSETELPNAPGRESSDQQPDSQPDQKFSGSISGVVLDIRDAIVPNASITLQNATGIEQRVEIADTAGAFTFTSLPAGTYRIKITAQGLETFISNNIVLHDAEKHRLPHIALPIAANSAEVTVTVTEDQLAEEQVRAEIQQRTLGVFPNFYTSYIWNAAPLKAKHKFQLALRSAIDPMAFVTTAAIAGEEQYRGKYSGYGDGAEGFGKRYGAAYGDVVIGRMIGGAILPSVFRQDPRYFYQGTGSVGSRAWHAISSAVICRGDNGHNQLNFSHVIGNFAAGSISNLYRPDEDRGVGLAVSNAAIHTGANAVANLVREFVLRGITTKVPVYAKGKPQPQPQSQPHP